MKPGALVFETGEIFKGFLFGGGAKAGEAVFNTSHTGYEEIATDPSYYNQIVIMTAPLQGNYGADSRLWQSKNLWIKGFVCLEIQNSPRDKAWLEKLNSHNIPVLSSVDTRPAVIRLREKGAVWSAIVPLSKDSPAQALSLIQKEKAKPKDWTKAVSVSSFQEFKGQNKKGPRLALVDFGFKTNILTELLKRASQVGLFPSSLSFLKAIKSWDPEGIILSNGPGDPKDVLDGGQLVQKLLGWRPLFGICMGHQVLARAIGAKTYKLKFGHRGSNHPIQDKWLDRIYISAQNHGYGVREDSLPEGAQVSHINLNDKTVAGITWKNCLSVQFHPENHPGPEEASELFDFFIDRFVQKSPSKSSFGQSRTGQSKSGQSRTGQSRTGQSQGWQSRTGQAKTGQVKSRQSRTGQVKTEQSKSGQSRTGQAKTGQSQGWQSRTGQSRTGQSKAGQSKSWQSRTGQLKSEQSKAGQAKKLARQPVSKRRGKNAH